MEDQFSEMAPRIYRFLLRLCGDPERASDMAQEALTCGWQRREQLRHLEALPTWLFRIALRTWSDQQKRIRPEAEIQFDEQSMEISAAEPEPIEASIGKEMGQTLWRWMDDLPLRQKQVLHLRVIEEMEISDIAEVVGIQTQNVRSNLAAARKKLRDKMAISVEENFRRLGR